MRKFQKFIALGAVATLGIFATACGGDSDGGATNETTDTVVEEVTTDTAADTTTTTMSKTVASDLAGPQTIVDLLQIPEFSTLVKLVTTAGLVETLSGEGPFTLLAPSNGAFEALAENRAMKSIKA